jgi:CRP-like cAMP-binding protein
MRRFCSDNRHQLIVRMAHLLSELQHRLKAIGRTRDGTFELPITQLELGDCLGMSKVHTKRVLKELREEGLLQTERVAFHLLNKAKLTERGQFEPSYPHLHP